LENQRPSVALAGLKIRREGYAPSRLLRDFVSRRTHRGT